MLEYHGHTLNFTQKHYEQMKVDNILDAKDLETLYSNALELIQVNESFLSLLLERKNQNPVVESVADCFLQTVMHLIDRNI